MYCLCVGNNNRKRGRWVATPVRVCVYHLAWPKTFTLTHTHRGGEAPDEANIDGGKHTEAAKRA